MFYTIGTNRITGYEDLAVSEGYNGQIGAATLTLESIQNDMALFEALICSDFQEISLIKESASDEQIIALMEASTTGFIGKLKEVLKKVWEKIKGLIKSFVTNLMNVIIRDNKKFVEKYKSEVIKKDLSKMKYRWSECKSGKDVVFGNNISPEKFNITGTDFDRLYNFNRLVNETDEELDKIKQKILDGKAETTAELLGIKNKVEMGEMLKEFKEQNYKDADEFEGLSSSLLTNIIEVLTNSKDIIKAFTKAETDCNKVYNNRLKELNAAQSAVSKLAPNGGTIENIEKERIRSIPKDQVAHVSKALNVMYACIQAEQETVTKALSVLMETAKWKIKECRAVFARAAAYRPVREDAEYMDALDDEAFHEVEELFEGTFAY